MMINYYGCDIGNYSIYNCRTEMVFNKFKHTLVFIYLFFLHYLLCVRKRECVPQLTCRVSVPQLMCRVNHSSCVECVTAHV